MGIGDMLAIQCQQLLYSRDGGSGNVKGVGRSLCRHDRGSHDRKGQVSDIVVDGHCRQTIEQLQSFCRRHRTASRCFINHELRRNEFEIGSFD